MMDNVFAVYDSCSGVFGDPFIAPSEASAKRVFTYTLSDPQLPKYIHDDSVLYCLGFYECKTGCFTSDVPPYVVCRGSSVQIRDVPPVTSDETEVNQDAE